MKYLIIILILCSCSAQKKLNRLYKNNPELFTKDSILIRDTVNIITPRTKIDTVYSVNRLVDTIRIEKNNLKVITYIKNDSIYIDAECDTIHITEYIDRTVYFNKGVVTKPFYKQNVFWILVILIPVSFYFGRNKR